LSESRVRENRMHGLMRGTGGSFSETCLYSTKVLDEGPSKW
jgi:hypothetical protein